MNAKMHYRKICFCSIFHDLHIAADEKRCYVKDSMNQFSSEEREKNEEGEIFPTMGRCVSGNCFDNSVVDKRGSGTGTEPL